MRKWIGAICVCLGVICILGAVGFAVYNQWEAGNAEEVSQELLEDIQSIIEEQPPEQTLPEETVNLPDDRVVMPTEMPTVNVDDYECIGTLTLPVLDLELPVLTEWSYAKLRKAPCHYYGSYYEKDFVIAAHNYQAHFGRLSQLQPGDMVIFTDVNGEDHCYEVVLLETLPKEATLEMIASGFALSLYTCTPGGASRVTIRCDAIGQ